MHSLPVGSQYLEMPPLYLQRPAADVMRDYLAEVARLVAGCDAFAVLAHIDYPVRYWPAEAGRSIRARSRMTSGTLANPG